MQKKFWMRSVASWLNGIAAFKTATRTPGKSRRTAARRKASTLLSLEALEDRAVPSAGALDTTYNGTGKNTVGFNLGGAGTAADDVSHASALQSNGMLVVAGSASGILAGSSFSNVSNPAAGALPNGIAVGDFNGDGYVDMAVANYTSSTVSVLIGNGDGTFQAQTTIGVGVQPRAIAVGDVVGSTAVDLVTANFSGQSVSILQGNGNGTFAAANNVSLGVKNPNYVAIGDLDGKNGLDMVTGNSDATVTVLLNNGNGTFALSNIAVPANPRQVLLAATRGAGQPLDIVTANNFANSVSVLLGNNNGTFGAATNFSNGVGANPFSIATGDFNGDSKLDLVAGNLDSNTMSFLAGNGNGTFGAGVTSPVGTSPRGIAAADFNLDGRLDVATANTGSNNFSVRLGNGNGTFQTQATFGTASGSQPNFIAVGNFNLADGAPDVALANAGSANTSVFTNASASGLFDFGVARFTTSGTLDPLFGNGGKMTIGFNIGGLHEDRAFAIAIQADQKIIVAGYAETAGSDFDFAVVRLNTNGSLDTTFGNGGRALIDFDIGGTGQDQATSVAITSTGEIYVAGRVQTAVGFNFGIARLTSAGKLDPTFNTTGKLNFRILPGTGANDDEVDGIVLDQSGNVVLSGFTTITQFDKDFALARVLPTGQLDTSFNGNGTLSIAFNINVGQQRDDEAVSVTIDQLGRIVVGGYAQVTDITDATFANQLTSAAFGGPRGVTIGDFNNDGLGDVANTNGAQGNVLVSLGNGNGTYSAFLPTATGTTPIGIAAGDFNNNGRLDLVTANQGSNNLSILLGNGNGSFTQTTVAVGTGPDAVAVGHFDNNTKLDIAVLSGGQVGVLLGNGNGSFTPLQTFAAGVAAGSGLTVGDFNNDGFADIAATNSAAFQVSIILSNGNGTFAAPSFLTTIVQFPDAATTGDFNRDGKLDLAIASFNGPVEVFLGKGNGTFFPSTTFAAGTGSNAIVSADLNSDGALDLAVTNQLNAGVVQVLLGDNRGLFGAPTSYAVGNTPVALAVGNISTDGAPDLVAGNQASGTLSTLLQVPAAGDFDFAVARVTSSGTLDTLFGPLHNGKRTISFNLGGANDDEANSIIVQPNGSIIIGGFVQNTPNSYVFGLARLNASGFQLDAQINSNGLATVSYGTGGFASEDIATSMQFQQSTGTIYLTGYAQTAAGGFDFAVSRLLAYNWIPIIGDWNGDGVTTDGLFDPTSSSFYLKNTFGGGGADLTFQFGPAGIGWVPIVGNWTGALGFDSIGLWDPVGSRFFLKNSFGGGGADNQFTFGPASFGWTPLTGDWDNNGTTTTGLFNPEPSFYFLANANQSGGGAVVTQQFGPASAGWVPISGNWQGLGSRVGLWDRVTSTFFAKFDFSGGAANAVAQFGPPSAGTNPLIGDWNGDGIDTIGIFFPPSAFWFLKNSFSGGSADISFQFGPAGLGGPMLQAAHPGLPTGDAGAGLQPDELNAVVNAALSRFTELGLTTEQLDLLRTVEFTIGDLPQSVLGYTVGNTVLLSRNADGFGWFADATPWDDAEFVNPGPGLPLAALPDSAASERMDLLTVVMHEMGHVLGFPDIDGGLHGSDLMSDILFAGTRRVDLFDAVFMEGLS